MAVARRLQRAYERLVLGSTFRKFREYTMIPASTYVANLAIARRYAAVPGCIIECGTWRGGMIAGIADVLGGDRSYFLFDSFQGLPPAKPIDGAAALAYQSSPHSPWYHDNCRAEAAAAHRAMALSRAREYEIIQGWFEDTLPAFRPPEPVAILRLDADWFDSTLICLDRLYSHVAPDGIIIIDDYYVWDGCSRAVHHFLAKSNALARVEQMDGVCVLRPGAYDRAGHEQPGEAATVPSSGHLPE